MQRHQSKARQKERSEIDELAKKSSTKTIETDAETITKLLAGKVYEKEDIIKVAQALLPLYNHDFDTQFRLVDNIDNFDTCFDNTTLEPGKPIFTIYNKPKKRWVLFCIICKDDKKIVLFKNPCGALVSFKLEKKIVQKFGDVEFIAQSEKDQKDDDVKSYGPLTVRNLKILLDFLKDEKTFVEFPKVKFAQVLELNNEKFDKVASLTKELGENEDFKNALKNFVDNLPLGLGSGMLEYKRIMEEELEKGEEEADLKRIQQAREKYLTQESVDKIKGDYKINAKEQEDEQLKEYELEIQNKYPDEMKKLSDIFEVLDDIKVDDKLYKALENISEILGIDYNKMKTLYEFKASLEQKEEIQKMLPGDISDIAQKLPPMKESSPDDCTPLDQLLRELTLGMDQENSSPNEQSQEEIRKIEAKYHDVKNRYEKWKCHDIHSINTWAKQIKGKLETTDAAVCETIAIMDRVLNLLTGGHRLRDTQILAVLIFFHGQNNKGRLCQIKTGEGKTVIVSLLAVIKALQGLTVDVITSNPLLAADGVDETKMFYSTFGLTVATNNPGESKACYTADVLYGTISSFQFDFLKDSFEGFNIRSERKFGQVVLDEVDSMLVDNGGHIAKLAAPYPGMECLRYIYIKIWQELHKAENNFVKECQEKIKKLLHYPNKEEARAKYSEFIEYMIKSERKIIKDKIRASNPTNIPLVPAHLKDYVASKLDTWIKNALHAKYNCHEHQQYRIITDDSGERVITPVDYLNTGVTMKNTIWSNGLHQFVQLKHNLYLTFESLTSSFISNIGYIKNYNDKNIFGLTGTLGSRAEQELLSHIYNIDFAKIPTYKMKKFHELPGIVVDDDSWSEQVTLEVLAKVDEGRAVLVICETEHDLITVNENLQLLEDEDKFTIRKYANEDNAEETTKKVKIGDVILATNIAGRGTNFRTENSLEMNGGLHVCVGFLPCNLRVEGQAFGRTSRQGNDGTAQLILRQSEVDELDILDETPSFIQIKLERDKLERSRLKEINDTLVKELDFKDELFKYFSDFHRNLKQEKMTESYRYVLQDLKEFWAFWLEKKNFKVKTIANTTPQQEFENFLNDARSIIDGTISHNPHYCVGLGDHYLEKNDRAGATRVLNHAIEMGGEQNYELLTGAHMKLFELAIQSGDQLRERFKKAVAKIFFVDVQKNEEYRRTAKKHLDHARASIRKEIDYIESCLKNGNPDFERILQQQDNNLFLKHIYSRLFCLKVHDGNIEELLKMVQNLSGGVDLNGKAPTNLENFLKMSDDPQVKNSLTSWEIAELRSIGVDALYSLKEIHDVPDVVIYTSIGQIIAGIAALCAGLAFLPIFPIMSSIAGTLISEGIIDIVMQIITQGATEFDSTDFLKGKFISYGVSLLSFGISAITQSVKILSKAVSFCRKLSSFLRKSKYLKNLCRHLANFVDKIGDKLQKMLTVAKFNKLSAADQLDELQKLRNAGNTQMFEKLGGMEKMKNLAKIQNLRKSEVLLRYTGEFAWKTAKQVGFTLIEELVVKPILNEILQEVIDAIKKHFKDTLKNSITKDSNLMNKIRSTPRSEIDRVIDNFMQENEVLKTAKEVGIELAGLCDNPIIDILTIATDIIYNLAEFSRYNLTLTVFLNRKLNGGNCNNDVDEVMEDICTRLSDQMFSLCCDVMKGNFKLIKMGIDWGKKKIEDYINDEDEGTARRRKKIDFDDDGDDDAKQSSKKYVNNSDDDLETSSKHAKKNDSDNEEPNRKKKSDQIQEDDDLEHSSKPARKIKEVSEDEDSTSTTKKKPSQNDEDDDSNTSPNQKKRVDDEESENDRDSSAPKKQSDQSEDDSNTLSNQKKRLDYEESDDDENSSKIKKTSDESEENDDSNALPNQKKRLDDEESEDDENSSKKKKNSDESKEVDENDPLSKPNRKLKDEESDSENTSKPKKKPHQNEDSDETSNRTPNNNDEENEESTKKKRKKEKLKKVAQILQDKLLEPLLNAALDECIQQIRESLKNSLKNSIRSNKNLITKLESTPYDIISNVLSNFIKGNATFNMAKNIGFKILGVMKNKAITALTTIFDIIKNSVDFGIYISTCASYLEQNLEGGDCNNNLDGIIEKICSEVADHLCKLLKDVGKGYVQIVKMSYEWDKEELKKIFNSKEIMKTVANIDTWKEIGKILVEEGAFQPLINKIIEEIKNIFKQELKKSIRSNKSLIERLKTTPVDQINDTVDAFIKGDETFNMAKKISFKLLNLVQNKTVTAITTTFNIIKNSIDFSKYFTKFSLFLGENLRGNGCENNIEQITEDICSKAADQMYILLQETGKDTIQLGKIGCELKDEDLKTIFNTDGIFDALADKEKWKDFGQMLIKEEVFQPLIDKIIEEIKNFFKKTLKNSIKNKENLVDKLRSSSTREINDAVTAFIRGDETLNIAKQVSFKLLNLIQHKAITALTTAFEVIKNSIDFSNYINKFSSHLMEHLHGGDNENNFNEINENICTKAADQMYDLLKASSIGTVQLAKITYELKDEDFKTFLNKDEIVSALTNKETWKTVAKNIIREEVFQPLIDKVIEEIKNSFRDTLKTSINNNQDLLKKIRTTQTDEISDNFVNFMRGDETLNIAKNISDKISGLLDHRAITALTKTFAIVKNSIDFAGYIDKLSSYLNEHLPGGDCDNNVEDLTNELCTKAADRMCSLLKDTGKDTVELAMIGYELRNEDLSKLFDKNEIAAALTDKEKWTQIGQTVINEEILRPLIDKAEEEVKRIFEKTLKDKILNNGTLTNKLKNTPEEQILGVIYIFLNGDETLNAAQKIAEKLSKLTENKAVTALTSTFTIIKNSINFAGYIDKFSSYLEKHLPGGDSDNNMAVITDKICSITVDQMYILLKNTGKHSMQLVKIGYEVKNEKLINILDKDQIVVILSDKEKWKQIGQTVIKEEILQPLIDVMLDEIKESFKNSLKKSIEDNNILIKNLQSTSRDQMNKTVDDFMKGDETLNEVKILSEKISGLVQHKTITALTTTVDIVKNSVEFASYINKCVPYLEQHLPGGDCNNKIEEMKEEVCSKVAYGMYSLLKEAGNNVIELTKIGYVLKNEDLPKVLNQDQIIAALSDKEQWKQIGQTIVKEEIYQPLLDKAVEEIKDSLENHLKESIRSNHNLVKKLETASVDEIHKIFDVFIQGDESVKEAKKIIQILSTLGQHKAITALTKTLAMVTNSIDFAIYINKLSSYLNEYLLGGDCNNNFEEILEEICSKTTERMFSLLKQTGRDFIEVSKIVYESRNEDFTKLLNKDQIVAALTDKEKWKQIGQTVIREEILQPLMDKAVEEIKSSFKRTLNNSIRSNSKLLEKLRITIVNDIDKIVETFMKADETSNAVNTITAKVSGLAESKGIVSASTTLTIIKNSIDFGNYCKGFSSYLEENLPGGNCDNDEEQILDEVCSKAADEMYFLLKSTSDQTLNLVKIGYELKNEDLTKFLDEDKIIGALVDKEKWKEITQTVIEEEVFQPLVDATIQEIKNYCNKILSDSIKTNDNVVVKLQTCEINEIQIAVEIFATGTEMLNTATIIANSIISLQKKRTLVNIASTDFDPIKRIIDFSKYTADVCSYLEENLTGGHCFNNVDEIVSVVTIKLANYIVSLLKNILRNHKDVKEIVQKLNIHDLKEFELSKESLTDSLKKVKAVALPILKKSVVDVTDETLKIILSTSGHSALEVVTPELLKEIIGQAPNLVTKENLATYIENVVPVLTQKITAEISKFVYNEDKTLEAIVPYVMKAITSEVSSSLSEAITNDDVRQILSTIGEGISVEAAVEDMMPYLIQAVQSRVSDLFSNETFNITQKDIEPTKLKTVMGNILSNLLQEITNQISELTSNDDIKTILSGIQEGSALNQATEAVASHLTEEITKWLDSKDFKAIFIQHGLSTFVKTIELQLNQEFSKQIYKFVYEKDIYKMLGLRPNAAFDKVVKAIVPYLTPEIVNQTTQILDELRFKDNMFEILGLDPDIPLKNDLDVVVAYLTEEIATQIVETFSEASFKEEIDKLLGIETSTYFKNVIKAIVPQINRSLTKVLVEAIGSLDVASLIDVVDLILPYLSPEITTNILTSAFNIIKKKTQLKMLNLKYGASLADIRRQYRKMALRLHPQKNTEDLEANEKYQKLLEVYHELVKVFEIKTDEFRVVIKENLKVLAETSA
ncbi:hypothetical protein Zmor_017898 [Zophobas morio]|uniref:Protein translocase subunit SecA n=1 Tax=Zophobas morio TaxID=2755281 RepID=A0AA38MD73_9CUCU|nr:hypothetical protein Zmor_017898 [Zophobas morio]